MIDLALFNSNPSLMAITAIEDRRYLYINRAFTEFTGYDKEDVVGKTPEQVGLFYDPMDAQRIMDVFRKNGRFKNLETKIVCKSGEVLDGLLSGESITMNGHAYFLTTLTDTTEFNQVKTKLHHQSVLQDVLMKIATRYINIPLSQIDDAIHESLEMMGKFVMADRVYIFDYDFKRGATSNTYEWCAHGITPQINNLQNIPLESIKSWVLAHRQGRIINIPDVSNYPFNSSTVKQMLVDQSIQSVVAVPMMMDNQCLGHIGFDVVKTTRQFSDSEIGMLKLYAQMVVNVIVRQRQENMLRKSLEEKAVLMNEIHHRVKNNLQVVSSLLYLQSCQVDNPELVKILKNSENRVKAISLLHEKIYGVKHLQDFDFKVYIETVSQQLIDQYLQDGFSLDFKPEVQSLAIDTNHAITCGLIVNELVTNAMEHAFIGRKEGLLGIEITSLPHNMVQIMIYDNGIGMPEDFDLSRSTSLGMQLVNSLTEQLDGTLIMEVSRGTRFTIMFPIPLN